MTLRLVFHGGKCCGIKTIYGFTTSPKLEFYKCEAVVKTELLSNDKMGSHVNSDMDYFNEEAPRESYPDRLDRLIEFCRRNRPAGMIEVILAQAPDYDKKKGENGMYPPKPGSLQMPWEPELLKRGFVKAAGPFLNSNSNNYIHVYHLVYDDILKAKKAAEEAAAARGGNFLSSNDDLVGIEEDDDDE